MYSNIPISKTKNSTVESFNNYYSSPVEINSSVLAAMTGYFTSKGFGQVAAESIAVTIITQAKQDGYNPMQILDSLRGLDSVTLSSVVSEILNYNRFKTSSLGIAQTIIPNETVYRNIIDVPSMPMEYEVVASANSINEGDSVTFTIKTTNVSDGTVLFWDLSGPGLNSDDIVGGIMSGTVVINRNTASVIVGTVKSSTPESNETMTFSLRKRTPTNPVVAFASTLILKSVISTKADYIVIEYRFLSGRDLDTRTRIAEPKIGNYLGWGFPASTIPDILQWSGDNTGTGTEAILFNVKNFRELNPTVTNLVLDCRAQWYSVVGTDPIRLRVSTYLGGTMVKEGFNWVNPTATRTSVLDSDLKTVVLKSTSPTSIGERVAVFKYDLENNLGFLDPTDETVYP